MVMSGTGHSGGAGGCQAHCRMSLGKSPHLHCPDTLEQESRGGWSLASYNLSPVPFFSLYFSSFTTGLCC